MYRAKDLGRGGAVFYSSAVEKRALRVADSGLYRAMKHREFSLYYQPQYRIDDGRLVGIEALLRWHRPREGIVAPADFIPAAEESGIIVEIGAWVIESACAQIAQWREAGVSAPRVALNLSLLQLRDTSLAAELSRHLGATPAAYRRHRFRDERGRAHRSAERAGHRGTVRARRAPDAWMISAPAVPRSPTCDVIQ